MAKKDNTDLWNVLESIIAKILTLPEPMDDLTTRDNTDLWNKLNELLAAVTAGGGGVTDGNKGDITVSEGGTNWQINTDGVTSGNIKDNNVGNTKLADMATQTIKGRATAGTGDPQDLSIDTVKSMLKQRIFTIANASSLGLSADSYDGFAVTAQAEPFTFSTVGGVLTEGRQLIYRLKDDGTPRALSWDAIYRAIGVTLPTTTVANKTLYVGVIYNATDTKWDVVAVSQEA